MEKYKDQYRIPSARASWMDYAAPGNYFITICTAAHQCIFGYIISETAEMIVSPIGNIVQEEWRKSFEIRTELFCDAFILMPNHLHAIVRIESVETHGRASHTHTHTHTPTKTHTQTPQSKLSDESLSPDKTHSRASQQKSGIAHRPPKSISSFIAGFKSAATTRINNHRNLPQTPVWQSRFHDHIIRNAKEYDQIKQYIETNPQRWAADKFYVSP